MVADGLNDVFVGPRPIEFGEPFYGRDREISELTCQLISERVVLLHSPSGAGKTSLIQAGLIPELQDEELKIPLLRPDAPDNGSKPFPLLLRVNRSPDIKDGNAANRYVLSVLTSLEQTMSPELRRPAESLSSLTLDTYLSDYPGERLLLIFDQFEEILTLDPTDEFAKREFFRQLGVVLQMPQASKSQKCRWALFAMREDYLAAAEPYFGPLPRRLSVQYRLGFLRKEPAIDAIRKTAAKANVEFRAADRLVANLLVVSVQRPDGAMQTKEGIHVEPVLLQVVCRRLWEKLPAGTKVIDETILGQDFAGGVDQVLREYFDAAVVKAAETGKVSERRIRRWFAEHLIRNGIRHSVPAGSEASLGITAVCLQALDRAFLIRKEARAGVYWIELSHDRLIKPINDANSAYAEKLTTFQKQATLWAEQGQPKELLVTGRVLEEGEKLLRQFPDDATEDEKAFLHECTKAVEEQDLRRRNTDLRRRNQRLGWGLFGIGLALGITVLILGVYFLSSELKENKKKFEEVITTQQGEHKEKLGLANRKLDLAKDLNKSLNLKFMDADGLRLFLNTKPGDPKETALLASYYDKLRSEVNAGAGSERLTYTRDLINDVAKRLVKSDVGPKTDLNVFFDLAKPQDEFDRDTVAGAIKAIETSVLATNEQKSVEEVLEKMLQLSKGWQAKTKNVDQESTELIVKTIRFSVKAMQLHLLALKRGSRLLLQFTPLMQFGLRENGADRRPLTYAQDGSTNSTKISINGAAPVLFGSKDGKLYNVRWNLGNGSDGLPRIGTSCEWKPQNPMDDGKFLPIRIRQFVEVVPGEDKKLSTCLVQYEITNDADSATDIVFWIFIDTMVNENDANYFSWQKGKTTEYAKNAGWITVDNNKSKQVPDYLAAIDNEAKPTMTCYFSFTKLLGRPERVFAFGKREDMMQNNTSSDALIGADKGDSHLKIEWRLQKGNALPAHKSTRVGFAYGLSKLPSQFNPK